jgi:hypothetical protein
MFAIFHREQDWVVTKGEADHRGQPEVTCRRGSAEYCFRRGRRAGRLVWMCWRRRKLFFASVLEPVGRSEGANIAQRAAELLHTLEPTAEIYFDEQ